MDEVKGMDSNVMADAEANVQILKGIDTVANVDKSSEMIELEQIEEALDGKVDAYNRFTKMNPMLGITYDKSIKKYALQYKNKRIKNKILNDLSEKMIGLLQDKIDETSKILKVDHKLYKNYNSKLVSYIHNSSELFDIQHIIKLSGVTDFNKKYNQFKDSIVCYCFKKNKFGGYIVKEFVNRDTALKIIHSCNKVKAVQLAESIGMKVENYYISKEQQTLNTILEVFDGEEMIAQKYLDGYRIDLYFSKYRIAIECDENDHTNRDKLYEEERKQHIVNKLQCNVIRYNPDDESFNINQILNKIHRLICDYGRLKVKL
jgi:very-short-patch-repair endonuclease